MTKPAFAADEYRSRANAIVRSMQETELDAMLVTSPESITYLAGYETAGYHIFQGLLMLGDGTGVFVVRNIEMGNVPGWDWLAETEPIQVAELADPSIPLLRALDRLGLKKARVGYEEAGLFLPPKVVSQLGRRAGVELVPSTGLVERHRAVKSPAEIDLIRSSCRMVEQAIIAGRDAMDSAVTDSDVAAAVVAELARQGSEYTGSPSYIVAGHASLEAHTSHARRPIADNEHVWLEVSASKHRYHGVASRVTGRGQPSGEVRDMTKLSVEAMEAMIAFGKPGVTSGEMDNAGRSVVLSQVTPDYWPNRSGYGMGISYPPGLGEGAVMDLKPNDDRVLRAGMLFHVLPIMKHPTAGAVGCTETLLITDTGCESLINLPREPLFVP